MTKSVRKTHHGEEIDDGVRLVEGDKERGLVRILALLHLVPLLGHVQLDVAKVRLEEPCKSLDTQSLCTLRLRVCVRMGMFGGVRMLVWMGRD